MATVSVVADGHSAVPFDVVRVRRPKQPALTGRRGDGYAGPTMTRVLLLRSRGEAR
jgi:hypothetical protein